MNRFSLSPRNLSKSPDVSMRRSGNPVDQAPLPRRFYAGMVKMDAEQPAVATQTAKRHHRQEIVAGHDQRITVHPPQACSQS
jgi:hypothetical protein